MAASIPAGAARFLHLKGHVIDGQVEHFDHLRDQDWLELRVGLWAACLAYDRGWTWVAGTILAYTREASANRYGGLFEAAAGRARSLVDRCAVAMRRRRLPL